MESYNKLKCISKVFIFENLVSDQVKLIDEFTKSEDIAGITEDGYIVLTKSQLNKLSESQKESLINTGKI